MFVYISTVKWTMNKFWLDLDKTQKREIYFKLIYVDGMVGFKMLQKRKKKNLCLVKVYQNLFGWLIYTNIFFSPLRKQLGVISFVRNLSEYKVWTIYVGIWHRLMSVKLIFLQIEIWFYRYNIYVGILYICGGFPKLHFFEHLAHCAMMATFFLARSKRNPYY